MKIILAIFGMGVMVGLDLALLILILATPTHVKVQNYNCEPFTLYYSTGMQSKHVDLCKAPLSE